MLRVRRMEGAVTMLVAAIAMAAGSASGSDGIFTSSIDLQRLIQTEQEVVSQLHGYVATEEARINKLKARLKRYDQIQEEAAADAEKYVSNPLNSYLIIKRLTADWQGIREMISSTREGDAVIDFLANRTLERTLTWPSDDDLNGAAVALTRLQDTYDLRPGDMSEGRLSGRSYGTRMSASDCFELGRQSYINGDMPHTLQWMEVALKKLDEEEKEDGHQQQASIDRATVYEYFAFSWYSQGDYERALVYTDELLRLVPDHPRAFGNKVYYEEQIAKKAAAAAAVEKVKGDDGSEGLDAEDAVVEREGASGAAGAAGVADRELPWRNAYQRLCRAGGAQVDSAVRVRLMCRYNHGHHPYLTLMPFKEEDVSFEPKVSIFYDVISDRELQSVKAMATPKFKRATVQNYMSGELETASYRISKTAWLKRSENEHTERIYRRVGDITGLNMDTSEELQVSNYGIGGHYDPHFDFAREEERDAFESLGTGNRIATWLFYLSDVELGGATVFTRANLTLWPKKGAAAFWYNLHRNGEGDVMTRHAACPVLAGTKWVSNFWIHERGQEFARPCSTDPFK